VSTVQKVAIVTGAGTGIGKSAALALLKDGYCVALVGRRKELLDRTAADSGAGERALALPADLARPEAVKGVFAAVSGEGRLDVPFNNAGMGAAIDGRPRYEHDGGSSAGDRIAKAQTPQGRRISGSISALRRARTRRPTPPPSTRSPG
jgi:NAD(P)-dependent dehydrogenase (short-subunit alcohol dehydrogenase family)